MENTDVEIVQVEFVQTDILKRMRPIVKKRVGDIAEENMFAASYFLILVERPVRNIPPVFEPGAMLNKYSKFAYIALGHQEYFRLFDNEEFHDKFLYLPKV